MCIYSSPLDQKGACCTSLTSLLMQCRAACQKRPSLRWNPRFAPAGQGCSFSARRVSCRRPYVEDPYWEGSETGFSWRCGFPRSCCFQGMKLKFLFITTFLEDPILRHPNARRSTEAKQHHSLLKTLTSSPLPTSQSAYTIQTGEGWRALVASLPKLHLRQSWLPYWEQALE